jgi:hypothetical protein
MKQRFQSIAHHAKMSFSIGNVLFFYGVAWHGKFLYLISPCHIVKRKRDVASKLLSREDEIDGRDERDEMK